MKKWIFSFFIILFLPLNVFAYSKNIIPGGESIGININTDGLIVVGFYKVNGEYIGKKNIKVGDIIKEINGKSVSSLDELNNIINESEEYIVSLVRNRKVINTSLNVSLENGFVKTGLYVKDRVIGVGTLSYIDPVSKIYGALGHEILLSETGEAAPVRDGNILISKINRIDKSRNGYVGAKDASISFNEKIGTIYKNTDKGIYGKFTSILPNKKTMKIAYFDEIKLGEAEILTVLSGEEIKKYKIKITDKYYNKKDTQKAFSFEVIDSELLSKTGGIVQGMSGSPIIQDNKIIGSVTNVVVDDVRFGYGISIVTMLIEGESN